MIFLDLCLSQNEISNTFRRNALNIFFSWFVNSGTYYGLSLGASDLGGNPYINFMLAAAVEIPAYLINLYLLNKPRFGRRISLSSLMLFAGVALLSMAAVPKDQRTIVIVLAMLGKLAITSSYGVVYIYSAEIFPTEVRNAGVGGASVCARIGGILCPYVNLLAEWWAPLPSLAYGSLAIFAGLLALLLPETLNKKLPETLEDGANFS